MFKISISQDHELNQANEREENQNTSNGHENLDGEATISPAPEQTVDNSVETSKHSTETPDEEDDSQKTGSDHVRSDHVRSHDTKMPLDLTHSHVIEVQPRILEEEGEVSVLGAGNEVELPGTEYTVTLKVVLNTLSHSQCY